MARKRSEEEIDEPTDLVPFVPPAKKDEEGISIADAMSSLWSHQEERPAPPPPPVSRTIYVDPPVLTLPNGPTKTWQELSDPFIKRAQWVGMQPDPDASCVEIPCDICQKPMWTRRAEESVCEICYRQEIEDLMERRIAQQPLGERYFNPLR